MHMLLRSAGFLFSHFLRLTFCFIISGTWFARDGVAGACGNVHSDGDLIVGLDPSLYGDLGAASKYCGKSLTVSNIASRKTTTAIVADAFLTWDYVNSLDM